MKITQFIYLSVLVFSLSLIANASIIKQPEGIDEQETLVEETIIDSQGLSKNKKRDISEDSWNYFHEKSDPTLDNISSDEKDYDGI